MPAIGNIGEKLDLVIRQGATFGPVLVTLVNPDKTPVNISGMTIRGHIRKKALDTVKVADLEVAYVDYLAGKFSFGLTDETTAAIVAGEAGLKDTVSLYVWDMEMEDELGRVTPVFYGDCKVFREVTHG